MNLSIKQLTDKANQIRKDVVEICVRNEAGHIASSLSITDILVALYYSQMNISDINDENRDRLVFSKAHGCYSLYAILTDLGYIHREDWENFYKGSCLAGCVERNVPLGIEVGCGSLGHGLPIATGIAYGAKLKKLKTRCFCIVGDGEMQEGSNWEAIQFAVKHELSNLIVVVDHNSLQAMDFLENILTLKGRKNDLLIKFKSFGFKTYQCNGHDMKDIIKKFKRILKEFDKSPIVLIAHTIKGYGLICMENIPKFHFRVPTKEELDLGKRYE